jgi:hypothetical protein
MSAGFKFKRQSKLSRPGKPGNPTRAGKLGKPTGKETPPTRVALGGSPPGASHDISDRRQIEALASPLRQELVDAIQLHGPTTIHALGELLGRAPDGLYYHVRKLLEIGLLREVGSVPSGGREAQQYDVIGRPLRIVHQPGNAPQITAVKRSITALLRTTQRDAHKALELGLPRQQAESPDFTGMRARTWLDETQLTRVRELLAELAAIASSGRLHKQGRSFGFTFVLTPLVPPRQGVLETKES